MRPTTALIWTCLACPLALLAAQEKSPSRSPFLPPGASAAAPAATAAEFEFTGLVSTGARTMVCVTAVPEKRSRWIAVGAQADGIKVVSHDPKAQQIVIEQGGRSLTLALKSSSPRPETPADEPAGPLPVAAAPLPVAGIAEPVPITDQEKEREARMLVSDLLEIGMIQRKAYEEAQRKNAGSETEANSAIATPEPATAPTPGPAPERR
jgi:hypothetical protein